MEMIEVTRVDETAAQRLADATGRVVYLKQTEYRGPAMTGTFWPSMTTDRDEAVGWGEAVAFVPQLRSLREVQQQVLGKQQAEDHYYAPIAGMKIPDLEPDPEPQLRVVRVLEYRGPQSWIERTLANSLVNPIKPYVTSHQAEPGEITEITRTRERLCRHCGGEHLGSLSEDECSANERKGRY